MPFTDAEFTRYQLHPDDILLNEGQSLELVGRTARYTGTPASCAFQNSIIRVQAGPKSTPGYLERLFRHCQVSGIFSMIATQTTSIAHLGVSRLARLQLCAPPLAEQVAIARFLEEKESDIEQYLTTKRRMVVALEERRRGIIHNALTRGLVSPVDLRESGVPWLGLIPSHWVVVTVNQMGRVQGGKALATRAPGALRPYLRVANVFDGEIDTADIATMPFTADEFSRYLLYPDDILLNEGQSIELVGRAARYLGSPPQCAFQNSLVRVQAAPQFSPIFLEHLFRHCQASGIFSMIATRTTSIAHLGVSRLARLLLCVPPTKEEQDAIASFLVEQECEINAAITAIQREITVMEEYRTRLIADAVTGQIDVRRLG